MTDIRTQIDRALESLLGLVQEDPSLREELRDSTREFFRGPPPAGDARSVLLDARRHVEWFLLERHSPTLRNTPAEALHARWSDRHPELAHAGDALLDSFTSIFEVESIEPSEGMVLSDMAALTRVPAAEPEAANAAAVGDLIAGRMYPIGEGLHVISSAAGYWRDERLREALRRDLEQMRAARSHKILHVSQIELESLLFGAGQTPAIAESGDPVGEARAFLARSGLAPVAIDALLARLAAAPLDASRWAHGARDTLGEILDELAFETEIDLEAARVQLLRAWTELARARAKPPAANGADAGEDARDPRRAIAAFDAARRSGATLDEVFQQLEHDLGLDAVGGDEEEDADAPLPDFPGVVGAVVQEFLWETALEDPAAAQRWRALEKLGRFAADLGLIEELDAAALLRFATFWLLEYDELASEREVRDLIEGLRAFASWAEQAHGLAVASAHEPLASLAESLPRAWRANRARAYTADDEPGALHELVSLGPGRNAGVQDPSGATRSIQIPDAMARELRLGDRLRARFAADGEGFVLCCYPPEIAALVAR